MLSFRTKIGAAAGVALLVALFALPSSVAMAGTSASARSGHPVGRASINPDSASTCNPNPFDPVSECTSVTGSGLHIDTLAGYADNNQTVTIPRVHIELYGPKGLIKNCADANLGPLDTTATCKWSPNDDRAAGDYCSEAWEEVSSGNYSKLGVDCIDVHS